MAICGRPFGHCIFTPLKTCMRIIRPRIVLSCLRVSSAAHVASYRSYIIQSCSASDNSKDGVDPPATQQSIICEPVCSLISVLHISAFIFYAIAVVVFVCWPHSDANEIKVSMIHVLPCNETFGIQSHASIYCHLKVLSNGSRTCTYFRIRHRKIMTVVCKLTLPDLF